MHCGSPAPEGGWSTIQDGFDPWVGRVLDSRYLITRLVGQGASGSVYSAESLAISREFAIKIINFKQSPAGVDPEQIRARLHREIEAISRLRNPHVVPFYEVIELYDNFVGIVMDFISGDTLEDVVRKGGAMSVLRATKNLRQIANGVHEAHEAGMIHRDLKPENIMLEIMPAGDDFVHILDFGIVRMDDGVSMTKGFLGTPLYASPEQAMAGDVDRRSDIYSLGAIFYFLLTGSPPFESDNVYEILRAHVRTPAKKIREKKPTAGFPAELEDLVDSMLAKSPTNRPQTLAEVIRRIDHLIQSGKLEPKDEGNDSAELDPIEKEARQTGGRPAVKKPEMRSAGAESSESEFHQATERERKGSGSFLVSSDRDKTGPKAAIFKRNPSRNTVRRMVKDSASEEMKRPSFDKIVASNTGVFKVGVKLKAPLTFASLDFEENFALVDRDGNIQVGNKDGVTDAATSKAKVTSVACLGSEFALVGHENGVITKVSASEEKREVFSDIRQASITALTADGTGSFYVAGSDSGRVYMCRTAKGDDSWTRVQDGPGVVSLAANRQGNMFAVSRKHKETEIFNTSAPRTHFVRFSTSQPVIDMAFSNDGHLIALLLEDQTIALHMVLNGQRMMYIKDDINTLSTIGFTADNELVGYFSVDGELHGVDLQRELAMA